jgi:hypothetical protein
MGWAAEYKAKGECVDIDKSDAGLGSWRCGKLKKAATLNDGHRSPHN